MLGINNTWISAAHILTVNSTVFTRRVRAGLQLISKCRYCLDSRDLRERNNWRQNADSSGSGTDIKRGYVWNGRQELQGRNETTANWNGRAVELTHCPGIMGCSPTRGMEVYPQSFSLCIFLYKYRSRDGPVPLVQVVTKNIWRIHTLRRLILDLNRPEGLTRKSKGEE